MKINIGVLIGILLLAVIAVAAFLRFSLPAGSVQAFADRSVYELDDILEVFVQNDFGREVCFSSCYPYLMEMQAQDGGWGEYVYGDCGWDDQAADCVPSHGAKKFRIFLADASVGVHRLKLPLCFDCAGESFKPEQAIYSNIFNIQK